MNMMVKKMRADPLDDYETNFIDVDQYLYSLLEQFKIERRVQNQKYQKLITQLLTEEKGATVDRISNLSQDF